MKCCWVFYLSSDNYYLYLLLSAYKDLIDTQTKYPVYCMLTNNVSYQTQTMLETIGIKSIYITQLNISINKTLPSWYQSALSKLSIIGADLEAKFDKIVYLDTDLWIKQNIDELMTKPHMSAVINHAPKEILNEYKIGSSIFCSGLFVWDFKNNPGLGSTLLQTLDQLPTGIKWHDQNILNFWFQNWKDQPELHLPVDYGLMNHKNIYRLIEDLYHIKIIHFTDRDRTHWPFETKVYMSDTYCQFKAWVEHINLALQFFNIEYNLNLPQLNSNNIIEY